MCVTIKRSPDGSYHENSSGEEFKHKSKKSKRSAPQSPDREEVVHKPKKKKDKRKSPEKAAIRYVISMI